MISVSAAPTPAASRVAPISAGARPSEAGTCVITMKPAKAVVNPPAITGPAPTRFTSDSASGAASPIDSGAGSDHSAAASGR